MWLIIWITLFSLASLLVNMLVGGNMVIVVMIAGYVAGCASDDLSKLIVKKLKWG